MDFTVKRKMQYCRIKTCGKDKSSCCTFSPKSEDAYNEGIKLALSELSDQLHALDPSYILIGNGIQNYDFNAGRGNPAYDEFVDILDGFCFEHTMAFSVMKTSTGLKIILFNRVRMQSHHLSMFQL